MFEICLCEIYMGEDGNNVHLTTPLLSLKGCLTSWDSRVGLTGVAVLVQGIPNRDRQIQSAANTSVRSLNANGLQEHTPRLG